MLGGMPFSLSAAMPLLERTPSTLAALLGGLPPEWTDATEGTDTWSPRTVVAHLLYADRTNWIPRARTILEHGRAVAMPAFDQDGQSRGLRDLPLAELLVAFSDERAENLQTLVDWRLDDDTLAREGEHPTLGRVTLAQLLAAWTAHDLAHLSQVSRVMAKQYRDAVGPWRTHLRIMDR